MMKSLYSKNCAKQSSCCNNCNSGKPNPCSQGRPQTNSCQSGCPTNKTPLEECKEQKKYAKKCGRPPDDCYDIKLAIPAPGDAASSPLKFSRLICPSSGGDTNSQMFHLCDNEVISLANTCGEITLSRQCLEEEDNYQSMKTSKKQEATKRKQDKKRGKERFKECKKNSKQIFKKYKDREKLRATNEKDYYKKCLKLEKKKVKAAKQKYKEKKNIAKTKMKSNKKKNKQRLKRLKQRLKQRCEEMKTQDPNDPKSESDSCDSMELEDPMDAASPALPCDGDMTCFSLTKLSEKPIYGCRAPTQVCVAGKNKQVTPMSCSQGMTKPLPKKPCAPCSLR